MLLMSGAVPGLGKMLNRALRDDVNWWLTKAKIVAKEVEQVKVHDKPKHEPSCGPSHTDGLRKAVSVPPVDTLEKLAAVLSSGSVDCSAWGCGVTKSPVDLLKEIRRGESTLVVDEAGSVQRLVRVAQVQIGREGKVLVETHQVKSNGTIKRRFAYPSEKMTRDEHPETAAQRCIEEELGVTDSVNVLQRMPDCGGVPFDPPMFFTREGDMTHVWEWVDAQIMTAVLHGRELNQGRSIDLNGAPQLPTALVDE